MGTQIQIAQTVEDEKEMNQILLKKCSLQCLPRLFSSRNPEPKRLGECDAGHQVIFCEAFRGAVMSNIRPVSGQPEQYHVFPKNGLCIEWNRTSRKGQGFIPGRYYLELSQPVSESSSALLKNVMALIVRMVRKTYPKKSGNRYPIFLGPNLAEKVDNKEAELVYPDGTAMPVVDNF